MAALRATAREVNTLVIFTSDHGLALGSHGLMGKQNMYDHTVGVPLIMAGPGVPQDRRLSTQTYLRDLYPTICDFAGLAVPTPVEGKSLRPILSGKETQLYPELYAYWHRSDFSPIPTQQMVRTERWKLIFYSHLQYYQLFDLANDPDERSDVSNAIEHAATRRELERKLTTYFARQTRALAP
jgi:arylsulfatase A-like enzyme